MQCAEAPYLIFQVPLLQLGVNASDIYSSCLRSQHQKPLIVSLSRV